MDERPYSAGDYAVYKEDGGIFLTKVLEDKSDSQYISYDLEIVAQLRRGAFTAQAPDGNLVEFVLKDAPAGGIFTFSRERGVPNHIFIGEMRPASQELIDEVLKVRSSGN